MHRKRFFFLPALLLFCAALLACSFSGASSYFTSSCPPAFRLVRSVSGELSGEAAEGAEEALSGTLGTESLFYTRGAWSCVTFSGELSAPEKLDSLSLFLWDERTFSVEKAYEIPLREPSETVGASLLNDVIPVNSLRGGRKTLAVQGTAGGREYVLARLFFIVRADAAEPAHITDQCDVSIPGPLLDGSLETVWKPGADIPSVTVNLPEGAGAALLTLEWAVPPVSFTVLQTGSRGEFISSTAFSTGFFLDSVPLDSSAAFVKITPAGEGCALSSLRVYPERYASFAVQRWEQLPKKVDLMIFSAHQDDELLFFGGMIPCYSAAGKTVAVVYMTDCGRDRYAEALDGLWTAGLKYHPVFVGWRDFLPDTVQDAMFIWKRNNPDQLLALVRLIRQYRPEVVVTHDFDGEYGHVQHILTAKLVAEAAVLAGDVSYDMDSVPWEVRKVYVHLYGEDRIYLDWDLPLEEGTVWTPMVLATEAYDKHRSQQKYFSMEKHGVLYDNRCFGLFHSTVGPDVQKNDLFENLP